MKLLDFNMSAEYCSDWSYLDALREVVQNALDLDIDEAVYNLDLSMIIVETYESAIPIKCFTMGVSQKADGAIGKYGEGLKLAMMILTRLGAEPQVWTNNYSVRGKFLPNSVTGVDTFNLEFREHEEYINNTMFTCKLLPEFDAELIKKHITPFGEFLGKPDVFDTLDDSEGNVYVNGLYVYTDEQLKHSYNFNPELLTLNRDRNMVDGITHALASAHLCYSSAKVIFDLLEAEAKDVSVIQYYYMNNDLKSDLRELYEAKYGNSPIVPNGTVYTSGFAVSLGSTAYSVFRDVGVVEAPKEPNPNVPSNVLTKFAEDNKRFMRRDFRLKFQELIKESTKWRTHDVY